MDTQNTSEPEPGAPGDRFSPVQERAIEWLAAGKSVAETSALVGVDRTTVHRWLREVPPFRARVNQCSRENYERLRLQLHDLDEKAIDAHAKSVAAGDPDATRFHLRHLFNRARPGPEEADVEWLRKQTELDKRAQRIAEKEQRIAEKEQRLAEAEAILNQKDFIAMMEKLHPGSIKTVAIYAELIDALKAQHPSTETATCSSAVEPKPSTGEALPSTEALGVGEAPTSGEGTQPAPPQDSEAAEGRASNPQSSPPQDDGGAQIQ